MPQLIALAVAGAGLYAGIRWLQRKVTEQAEAVARQDAARTGAAADAPREMGQLEWDADAKAYRPVRRQ